MKWFRLCLFLLLMPGMLVALGERASNKLHKNAVFSSKLGYEILEKISKLPPNDLQQRLALLEEALSWYEKAKNNNDTILINIKIKDSKQKKKQWRKNIKAICKLDNKNIVKVINSITKARDNTKSSIAYEKANYFYQASEQKVSLALSTIQNCPERLLDNADAVASTLNEGARLYEEAAEEAHNALSILCTIPSSPEASKSSLKQAIDVLQENARIYRKDAAEWPLTILKQKKALEATENYYHESEKKATLAVQTIYNCPPRLFHTVDAVTAVLNGAAILYEEAAAHAQEALQVLRSAPYSQEEESNALEHLVKTYQSLALSFKEDADKWPHVVLAALKERLETLKEERRLFDEKKMHWASYDVQKQIAFVVENLTQESLGEEVEQYKAELLSLNNSIEAFEKEADKGRLTKSTSDLSLKEFQSQESERREFFFLHPNLFFQTLLLGDHTPSVIPLDGQINRKKNFSLFTEQFYRFLVQSETCASELLVRVYDQGQEVHKESIALPLKKTLSWERYLREGMILIPQSKIKEKFGIDLRIRLICDPKNAFSMIIAQKGNDPRFAFSVSLHQNDFLYACRFFHPPPWQLGILRKPLSSFPKPPVTLPSTVSDMEDIPFVAEPICYPILDQFVEMLKKEPLTLAQYVQNEIALADPILHQENGIFYAPGIQRTPLITYLEKEGSPWEQCQLLVYLLHQAGYRAVYAQGSSSLQETFAKNMLLISETKEDVIVHYPWVLFFDGKEWISLFPWMKETEVHKGHDLYGLMPEEYGSVDRWIIRYLNGDENIVKHRGTSENDTAGTLFLRFVKEQLQTQGLSISDVGIQSIQIKKQFSSWSDFPRPSVQKTSKIFSSLDGKPELFARLSLVIFSHENPEKKLSFTLPVTTFSSSPPTLDFSSVADNRHLLHVQMSGQEDSSLLLDDSDHQIDIEILYEIPVGKEVLHFTESFSIVKGTKASLYAHCGGGSSQITSYFHNLFSLEKDENKKMHALFTFTSAAYFEKCAHMEQVLARLHRTQPTTLLGFGLTKILPHNGAFFKEELPQVDMFWFRAPLRDEDVYTDRMQYEALATVNASANEHQILRDVFNDHEAISACKLLQKDYLKQQKEEVSEKGFLFLTSADAQELNITSPRLSEKIKAALNPDTPYTPWAYTYITSSQEKSNEMLSALILSPTTHDSLLCINNLLSHGASSIPHNDWDFPDYFHTLPSDTPNFPPSQLPEITPHSLPPSPSFNPNLRLQDVSQFDLVSPWMSRYIYNMQATNFEMIPFTSIPNFPDASQLSLSSSSLSKPTPDVYTWSSDVRLEHKSFISSVADPVDVVTGAFYIDEVDLALPGPFSLEIRRNYNSQKPLIGNFGYGWKLSLSPFLVQQDGKLYATEADGTVITYSFNADTSRWEISPEDNPELYNFNQLGVGSLANPFHSYIENDILYGSDGSKRYFEEGLLKKWVNANGNFLTFFYSGDRLISIESSTGAFCSLLYNHKGMVSEISSKDGRRISYNYNAKGDLTEVTLPNTATILYEYDRLHRIIREVKPNGKVLENIYDEQGRVVEQRSPMGPKQTLLTTATFAYQDGETTVTDAGGGKTTYNIFQKQIYKVTDPLGNQTLWSWFLDETSWFDPETESIVPWDKHGGSAKSLKATTDKRGLITSYLYDTQGNPVEIILHGDDLTGNGVTSIVKKSTYNNLNLCIQEEVLEQKTVTTYDDSFPYLPKRVEKYDGDTLLSSVDLHYTPLGQLEKEDRMGSITLLKYDARGFPIEKIRLTGTDDPDVVTKYTYNLQGQCIEIISSDELQHNVYDIMGNLLSSKKFAPSGELLFATYFRYNLNNELIWKQTANEQNTLILDYHPSGKIKASIQTHPSGQACTLYEYDARGYLIEEVDPLGHTIYREHDALGNVIRETKEGCATQFTYEPGGLIATTTSPAGAKMTRLYTTNGLLKEETFPDGTKSSFVYDFFGRLLRETKNGITKEISYDDSHHCLSKTIAQTKEIQEFDAAGNLLRFTDAAGYTTEKTYDSLGRIKTETTPSGQQTFWSYQGDTVICTSPSKEKTTHRYAGGRIISSTVEDQQGTLLATSSSHFDPHTDIQTTTKGSEVTTTWLSASGFPLKVQKGDITTTYEYDLCDNCTSITDGGGRTTRQTFDALGRMTQKELPDNSVLTYTYDLDSHLSEFSLPNGMTWAASYDTMGRKESEELRAGSATSQHWEYTYENGCLTAAKDPKERIHTYHYDSQGRLLQEDVSEWHCVYTYDPRGLLLSAKQLCNDASSIVTRTYDTDGKLSTETIYLNNECLQKTEQTWTPSERSLSINSHERNFTYQNNKLTGVSTQNIDLFYTYDQGGLLKSKQTPLSNTAIDYNSSSLPCIQHTNLPDTSLKESLEWTPSGKLSIYSSPSLVSHFTYTTRGYLQSTDTESYEFDFGLPGIGVCTDAPGRQVLTDGLDPFGKVLSEHLYKQSLETTYNPMGEVLTQGARHFEWDPFGRLLKIIDPLFTWQASYDALGRRLKTHYIPRQGPPLTTTSLYDPEEEFREIGVNVGNKTFWKILGPTSCDALLDETGAPLFLIHNALGNLTAVVSTQETRYLPLLPSHYGPTATPPPPIDLFSYALSLTWHSQNQDPSSLIWMGARYYDPKAGRFLSPDPVGYPISLNLYSYAGGDPINYHDSNGRFFSHAYLPLETVLIDMHQSFVNGINLFSSRFANKDFICSTAYQTGSFDLPSGAIGFINGIRTTQRESLDSAERLSQYAQRANIYGTYNATHTGPIDVLECAVLRRGVPMPPVQLLKKKWSHLIDSYGTKAKFLEICHSGGADQVMNALLSSPKSVRQQIIVLAIAPSVIIPDEMCYKADNYISKRDFVTYLDIVGTILYRNQLHILEPHPDANFFDHDFLSPTFEKTLIEHLEDYITNYGGKK